MCHLSPFNEIHRRLGHKAIVDQAAGWFFYKKETPLAKIMIDAKYAGRPGLVQDLARKFAHELVADNFFSHIQVLVPTPMHWFKEMRRGYNQAEVICWGIEDVTSIPVVNALRAPLAHRVQSRQSRLRRYVNLQGTISLSKEAPEIEGKHVLLVDDIITTGSTLRECILQLGAASPASISVLAIAVTQ